MSTPNILQIETVDYDEHTGELVLIDQTRLPGETVMLRLRNVDPIWEAIHALRVLG